MGYTQDIPHVKGTEATRDGAAFARDIYSGAAKTTKEELKHTFDLEQRLKSLQQDAAKRLEERAAQPFSPSPHKHTGEEEEQGVLSLLMANIRSMANQEVNRAKAEAEGGEASVTSLGDLVRRLTKIILFTMLAKGLDIGLLQALGFSFSQLLALVQHLFNTRMADMTSHAIQLVFGFAHPAAATAADSVLYQYGGGLLCEVLIFPLLHMVIPVIITALCCNLVFGAIKTAGRWIRGQEMDWNVFLNTDTITSALGNISALFMRMYHTIATPYHLYKEELKKEAAKEKKGAAVGNNEDDDGDGEEGEEEEDDEDGMQGRLHTREEYMAKMQKRRATIARRATASAAETSKKSSKEVVTDTDKFLKESGGFFSSSLQHAFATGNMSMESLVGSVVPPAHAVLQTEMARSNIPVLREAGTLILSYASATMYVMGPLFLAGKLFGMVSAGAAAIFSNWLGLGVVGMGIVYAMYQMAASVFFSSNQGEGTKQGEDEEEESLLSMVGSFVKSSLSLPTLLKIISLMAGSLYVLMPFITTVVWPAIPPVAITMVFHYYVTVKNRLWTPVHWVSQRFDDIFYWLFGGVRSFFKRGQKELRRDQKQQDKDVEKKTQQGVDHLRIIDVKAKEDYLMQLLRTRKDLVIQFIEKQPGSPMANPTLLKTFLESRYTDFFTTYLRQLVRPHADHCIQRQGGVALYSQACTCLEEGQVYDAVRGCISTP